MKKSSTIHIFSIFILIFLVFSGRPLSVEAQSRKAIIAELRNKAYVYSSSLDKETAMAGESMKLHISAKRGQYNVAAKPVLIVGSSPLKSEILQGDVWQPIESDENKPLFLLLNKLQLFQGENKALEAIVLKTDALGKASIRFDIPNNTGNGNLHFDVFFLNARYGYTEHIEALELNIISLSHFKLGVFVLVFFIFGSQAFFLFFLSAPPHFDKRRFKKGRSPENFHALPEIAEEKVMHSLYPWLGFIRAWHDFRIFSTGLAKKTGASPAYTGHIGHGKHRLWIYMAWHALQRMRSLLGFSLGLLVFSLLIETQMMLALTLGYILAIAVFFVNERKIEAQQHKRHRYKDGMSPLLFTFCSAISLFAVFLEKQLADGNGGFLFIQALIAEDFIENFIYWLVALIFLMPQPALLLSFFLITLSQVWKSADGAPGWWAFNSHASSFIEFMLYSLLFSLAARFILYMAQAFFLHRSAEMLKFNESSTVKIR